MAAVRKSVRSRQRTENGEMVGMNESVASIAGCGSSADASFPSHLDAGEGSREYLAWHSHEPDTRDQEIETAVGLTNTSGTS